MRYLVLICCVVLHFAGPSLAGEVSPTRDEQPAAKPNILFIFADDQSYETIGALGNAEIKTPTLDQLVGEGISFTNAFNMGSWSGAVCVASRTMLNSGRFLWRANKIHGSSEKEREEGRWWSEQMKQAGYRTYMTGKWHCKAKAEKSFDVTSHVRGGMPKQSPEGYNRPSADGSDTWSPYDTKFGGFWEGGKHWSEVVADDAIGFLEEADSRDEPFFMYVAFNAPHDPRQSPKEFVEMYPVENLSTPENFLPIYPFCEEMKAGKSLRDEKLATFPRTEYGVKVNRQEYYAIISHMDQQIGRILKKLRDSGNDKETWIFFTADHGLACGHHGLMGKQNMYDHSLRVPFIVVPPNAGNADRKIDEMIYLQDVMATTLDIAGIEKPEHVEFQSVLPILAGQKSVYPDIYGAYLKSQRCIRTATKKLIVYPNAKRVRLFDLTNDPQEMNDLANAEGYESTVAELFRRLVELQKEMGDELDLEELFPELK